MTSLLVLLAGYFPLVAFAIGSACHLPCCASRAPDGADSCASGSCPLDLSAHAKSSHLRHRSHAQGSDRLCGLPQVSTLESVLLSPITGTADTDPGAQVEHSRGDSRSAPDDVATSAAALSMPCQHDCGAGTFNYNSQRRPRDTAALAFATRARPTWTLHVLAQANAHTYTRDALRWQANPRAPPVLL